MVSSASVDNGAAREVVAWRITLSALCASLVGLGIARFAYAPLLPAIIAAHWFSASSAAYLGAANLAGYLAGALLTTRLSARLTPRAVLRGMMAVATVSMFACAWPVDFAWFFAWRFVSGASGGALMVLAAPTVLPHIAPSRRGLAGGVIFMGVGIGIAASGTLVPLLVREGPTEAWIGLGILSAVLTLVAWGGWPDVLRGAAAMPGAAPAPLPLGQLRALYAEYALNAFGLVPHMIFLVDFVARGLGQGLAIGARYWVAFGIGAVIGPVFNGYVADKIGFALALRAAFVIEAITIAIPALTSNPPWLIASSVIVGAFTPGIVPLVLGRIQSLLAGNPAAQKVAWSRATAAFATLQAAGAYGMSYLVFESGGDYALLFALGAGATLLALVIDAAVSIGRRGRA